MSRTTNGKPSHAQTLMLALLRIPCSTKPQLCGLTGLPASTVHNVMAELVQRKLVTDGGVAPSDGGRRAVRYQINRELGVLAAVSIRPTSMEAGLFDLAGQCLRSVTKELAPGAMGPESYTAEVAAVVQDLLSSAEAPCKRCFGVGVTVPGPADYESGTVLQLSCAPMWQRFPLANRLSEALHLPVAVDKDVYACIQYLEHSGQLKQSRCAVYLSICDGISSALMIGGQVFRGTHSLAGEIGHLTVRRDGIPCSCGNTGCLELYCSDIGIVKQYNAQSGNHCAHVDEVLTLMAEGDPIANKIFSQAMRYLVDTTSTIIMSYDPQELVIYCRWLNRQRSLYFHMLDALYLKSVFTQKHAVDIHLLDEEPLNLHAAVALAQNELLVKHCEQLIGEMEA
ncbi:MAG: ROK family transcriptional regulator [Clostridia bacterium]